MDANDGSALRAAFDAAQPYTVGIEDELLLLDPETLELVPRAQQLLARLEAQGPFKLELPASQLEIITPAFGGVGELGTFLLDARRTLARAAADLARPASAGVHPFSSGDGELNALPQYRHTIEEFGLLARRELVCALQVHVAVGDAGRALAVYNAARSYLPLIAALAANAPFYEGRDSGLASVRPKLSELLPRQGIPPVLASWEEHEQALRWGEAAGAFEPRTWWWELRPHWRWGTLEFRVPDGQATVADAVAVAAVVQSLVVWLDGRCASGEQLPVAPSWKIAENRWSACRHGVLGEMADLDSGKRRPTRELLERLLEQLAPVARPLGGEAALAHAGRLLTRNGAVVQREVGAEAGVEGVARWLADCFCAPLEG